MTESKKNNATMMYVGIAVAGIAIGALGTLAICGKGSMGGGDPVVADLNGTSIRASEAFAPIKTRLFDLEEEVYRTKEQAINDHVQQKLLEMEAKKQNMPVAQLLEKETAGPVDPITKKDVEAFLASKGLSLSDPRIKENDVMEYLKYRKGFDKRQAYVSKLRETAKVKVLLKEPESVKLTVSTDGYPAWGNAGAKVTIVEFSDFQCPFCSRAVPVLDRIKKEYGPDKVRIVFRDMPLPSHDRAIPAALASHCANEQGKFWEMHDALFRSQASLGDADLKKVAKEVQLDEAKYTECYDKKKHMSIVEKSKREAEALGIDSTPSFVINGALIRGAQPFEKFKEKIDRALKAS